MRRRMHNTGRAAEDDCERSKSLCGVRFYACVGIGWMLREDSICEEGGLVRGVLNRGEKERKSKACLLNNISIIYIRE